MTNRRGRQGFTLIEVMVVVVIAVIIALVAMFVVRGPRRHSTFHPKDASTVRGLQQSMAIWANMNKGMYPLPSVVDASNTTVAEEGAAKDNTANIYSLLIYTGGISVEMLISIAEANTRSISQDEDYQFDNPKAAIQPANAKWDPAFTVDFTGGKVGNASFAHIMPGGTRSGRWKDTFTTKEAVVGNRGPEVKSISRNAFGVTPAFVLASSNTFLIHGAPKTWEGNIAYNDGHVNFETRTDPAQVVYKDSAGKPLSDCLFFDEPDDAAGTNAFMSIWTRAGSTNAEFKGIWD